LEDEVEDLDDEDYKTGLRLIIDGYGAVKVDDFYTKIITAEKNKHTQVYKTIIKKLVLGTLALKDTKNLYDDLLSSAELTDKEQKEIDKNNLADNALKTNFIISEEKPPIPDNVESNLSFNFEDIVLLGDRDLQQVFREVDTIDLAKAIKTASEQIKEKVFRNMSIRAQEDFKKEMENLGNVSESDVEEARRKFVNIVKYLEDTEVINVLG
jgi:polyhydroxyalkanoate synthesis regulator phasin